MHQCERWRNCHIWWSGNWESQTNTCEFYSGIVQGYRNETSQWVGGKRSHGTSDVSNVSSERPLFNVWPKVGKSHGTPYLDVDYDGQKRQLVNLLYNLLFVIGDHGDVEKAYGILINRHPSLCQHNRHHLLITQCPHCQSSFCPPLKLSFQSRFSMFDNISDVMILFSNAGGRHFTRVTHMRTYRAFGVPPPGFNLII